MTRFISALLLVLVSLAASVQAGTLTFTTYYHNDHLGSPVAATDERNELLWRAHFRPYGERQENPAKGAFGTPGYTGHAQDKDSGLVYAGARYYDPLIGRFMAVDPESIKPSDPATFNRFSYGNNNPYKYVDPDGREVFQIGIQIAAPKLSGLLAYIVKPSVQVTGIGFGVAFSAPNIEDQGEYDVGLFSTLELESQGLSTGKIALGYSESVHSEDSVKDIAGVEGGASMDFAVGGPDVSYSERGIESLGLHIGLGVGGAVSANATSVISMRHRKIYGFDGRAAKTSSSSGVSVSSESSDAKTDKE